jgi:hypothetical protein
MIDSPTMKAISVLVLLFGVILMTVPAAVRAEEVAEVADIESESDDAVFAELEAADEAADEAEDAVEAEGEEESEAEDEDESESEEEEEGEAEEEGMSSLMCGVCDDDDASRRVQLRMLCITH